MGNEDNADYHIIQVYVLLPGIGNAFHAILEKGTLDAIYLSGGNDKELAQTYLDMAVLEMARVLVKGGVCMRITAACTTAIKASFQKFPNDWKVLRDGEFFVTEDGVADEEKIENVDREVFAHKKVKKQLLFAFIKVRDNEDITASTEHFPLVKGKMRDLEEDPRYRCLFKEAFSIQSNPVIAKKDTIPTFDIEVTNPAEEDNNNATDNTTDNETSWSVTSDYVRKSCTKFATLCNKDTDFAENAARDVDMLRNNIVYNVLKGRLGAHLKNHHALKFNHYTVNFIRKNMERAVAILKLHGFYRKEERLKIVDHKESLLKKDIDFGDSFDNGKDNPDSQFETTIGAYLMKDCDSGDMIRAGSTTTSFGKRLMEHLKCSKLKRDSDRESNLYSSYPHEDASEKDKRGFRRKGSWDDIGSYIAIGWEKKESKHIKDLFEWDNTTMCGLRDNRNTASIEKKQERMMVYLFELLLSMSLEPSKNISSI